MLHNPLSIVSPRRINTREASKWQISFSKRLVFPTPRSAHNFHVHSCQFLQFSVRASSLSSKLGVSYSASPSSGAYETGQRLPWVLSVVASRSSIVVTRTVPEELGTAGPASNSNQQQPSLRYLLPAQRPLPTGEAIVTTLLLNFSHERVSKLNCGVLSSDT